MTRPVAFAVGPDASLDNNQLNRDTVSLNPFNFNAVSSESQNLASYEPDRFKMDDLTRNMFRRERNRNRVTPPPTGAERAAIARSLQAHTHDPEGVITRNSAPTEDDGTASDTGRPSGASTSDSSPDQARRALLAGHESETRSFEANATTAQGDTRRHRLSMLTAFVANRRASTPQQSNLSPVSSTRDFSADGASSGDGWQYGSRAAASGRANRTGRSSTNLERLAITSGFATHLATAVSNSTQRPSITASGSPSLILRVSTDDGVTGASITPRAGGAPPAGSPSAVGGASSARPAPTVVGSLSARPLTSIGSPPVGATHAAGGASQGRGTPAAGVGSATNTARPANASPSTMPSSAQTAGGGPAADNTIPAEGALPAAGGAPAVGTMPAIGRVAYITVQSPDNRFYTVRVDLTDAAPNATYNITINIPPP